jgi:hypothetical protein
MSYMGYKVLRRESGEGWAVELRNTQDGFAVWDVENCHERIDDVIYLSADKKCAEQEFWSVVKERRNE